MKNINMSKVNGHESLHMHDVMVGETGYELAGKNQVPYKDICRRIKVYERI
jgi:hypothetical protein